MKRLEEVGLIQVLIDWGLHECAGRLRDQLPAGFVSTPENALNAVLQSRAPFIGGLLLAQPLASFRVWLEPADVSALHALEHPLDGHSKMMMGTDGESADHIRKLAAAEALGGAFDCYRQV